MMTFEQEATKVLYAVLSAKSHDDLIAAQDQLHNLKEHIEVDPYEQGDMSVVVRTMIGKVYEIKTRYMCLVDGGK